MASASHRSTSPFLALKTMLAAVVHKPGDVSVLKLEERRIPNPSQGQVLICVRACGLNHSELFTRQGHFPNVQFPRILGIEAIGTVVWCHGGNLREGQVVATAVGGLGRDFDGGYAQYVCVPSANCVRIGDTFDLTWSVLGALPEMLQTAYGSLKRSLRIEKGDRLLIHGGTTSVGLAAAAIAKGKGVEVMGSTRREGIEELLMGSGCTHVVIDNGSVKDTVYTVWPKGPTKVLELVGTNTLIDSLSCCQEDGSTVCMTGMVGNSWKLPDFEVTGAIPTAVSLTTYSGDINDFRRTPLEKMVRQVAKGELKVQIGKVFKLEEVVEAHRAMEENQAGGKIVLVM